MKGKNFMAQITLWNSIAKRRRSLSDTFYDNGLATLKGYLEDRNHTVEVIDWARDDFFTMLTVPFLARWIRNIYSSMARSKSKLAGRCLGFISVYLQEIHAIIQEVRFKKQARHLAYELKNDNARIFGVKLWYGEAFKNAKELITLINKIAPEIITIAGGYHVTLYEEHLLENSTFDLGVVCEGEFALEKILAIIDQNKENWNKHNVLSTIIDAAEKGEIENLIYRKNGKIHKTKRRHIAGHSLKSIPRYTMNENKVRIHVMVESLGCDWGKCHFCVHPHFYSSYSLRSPDEVVNEIEEMLKIGIGVFRFAGSDTPPHFGARIAQKIKERRLKVVFGIGSRAIKGAQKQYEHLVTSYTTLIENGLRAVFMGGETGNDIINEEVMNKGVFFDDIVTTIKALREAEKRAGAKVFLSLAFIYPAPLLGKVTLAQVKEDNLRLLKETMPDSVMITPPGPFLHTKWYDEKDKFGFKVDEHIIRQAMEYEYVLYKPPHLWPNLGISLEGKPFKKLLAECNEFRNIVEKELHIPTDLSDEHFLMFYAAGIREKAEVSKAKEETMLDIVSCDYSLTKNISMKVYEFSLNVSRENITILPLTPPSPQRGEEKREDSPQPLPRGRGKGLGGII